MHRLLTGLLSATLLAGCSTVLISSPRSLDGVDVKGAAGGADRAIMVSSEGYFLFQFIPIVGGDIRWSERKRDIRGGIRLFSNPIRQTDFLAAMTKYAEREDCDLVDVVINNKYTAPIGFMSIADVFATIVGYSSVTYSGVLRAK